MVKKLDILIYIFALAIIGMVLYLIFIDNENDAIKKIILEKKEISISEDENIKIKYSVEPESAITQTVKWNSSDPSIVTVDSDGNVYGKSVGDAIVVLRVGNKLATCKIKVTDSKFKTITLNKKNTTLEKGITEKLVVKVKNSVGNKKVKWTSSNLGVVDVNQDGYITAKSIGVATITATNEIDGKGASCMVVVKPRATAPIVPFNYSTKYLGTTLKYYIQNNTSHYLTYIWMDDPYNQIKKIESTVAQYGKLMNDYEMDLLGKKSLRKTIGDMLNSYISNGMISKSKTVIAFNGSGFYDKRISSWQPVSDYYDLRSNSWFVLTDGKLTRNRIEEVAKPQGIIIGISPNGDLKIYDEKVENAQDRRNKSNKILADNIKNTWSFSPVLIKKGKIVSHQKSRALRNVICQIDSNNYVMYTSLQERGLEEVATKLKEIGCKTAFNLDGGGSTSMFYKEAGSTIVKKIKCSEGNKCRSVVDGIYFTEK